MLIQATQLATGKLSLQMRVDDLFASADFVSQIERLLRSHARRFPALQSHTDDLVNVALRDLWQFAQRNPALLEGLEPGPGWTPSGAAWEPVARMARTILSRRAIDFFRSSVARLSDDTPSSDDDIELVRSEDPSQARQRLLQQMIDVCTTELALVSHEERDSLWRMLDQTAESQPLPDAERQRISRLRKRLAAAIRRRLGESASSLLASDLKDD